MGEFLKICLESCNKKRTKKQVLNSLHCNFCDVPYILMEIEKVYPTKKMDKL